MISITSYKSCINSLLTVLSNPIYKHQLRDIKALRFIHPLVKIKINPKLLIVCNKSESKLVANIHINMTYIVKSHSLNQPT
jgi:hypothetical protein